MSRTYPTSYPGKFSRIPKRKTQQQQLNSPRAHEKIMLPPIEKQNFYRKPPPPAIRSKRRENYEKYELRLAEKDQKLLEAHECIQVCVDWLYNLCPVNLVLSVPADEINTLRTFSTY